MKFNVQTTHTLANGAKAVFTTMHIEAETEMGAMGDAQIDILQRHNDILSQADKETRAKWETEACCTIPITHDEAIKQIGKSLWSDSDLYQSVMVVAGDYPRRRNVWLDDEPTVAWRAAMFTREEGWENVRWPEDVIALLKTGTVAAVSLDHDLGDKLLAEQEGRKERTGVRRYRVDRRTGAPARVQAAASYGSQPERPRPRPHSACD
jgi:hypothetical protein